MKTWTKRVKQLEDAGCDHSDAQGVADAEVLQGLIVDDNEVSMLRVKNFKPSLYSDLPEYNGGLT